MSPVPINGPTQHPLLGMTAGVDFSPKKVCSFDCVYCGVGIQTTRKTMERERFYPVQEIVEAVEKHVEEHGVPDTFFLTGSGEPMLYAGFGEMASALKALHPDAAFTVYTNGTLLGDPEVRREIALCDPIQGNLDTVDRETLLRLSRPHRDAGAVDRVAGYKALKAELTGQKLWLHGVFVRGIGDDPDSLQALGEAVAEIGPDLFVVRTTRRATEGLCEPVDAEFRDVIEAAWSELDLPVRFMLPQSA